MPIAKPVFLLVVLIATTAFGQTFDSIPVTQAESQNLFGDPGAVENSYAGLLGKRYVDLAYARLDATSLEPKLTFNGVDATVNIPLRPVSDFLPHVGVDAFFNLTRHKLDSAADTVDFTLSNYSFGTSIYYEAGGIRPFVQIGANHWNAELEIKGSFLSIVDEERHTELLLNIGVESQLAQTFACRTWFDLNSKYFTDVGLHTDLIWWPHDRVFVRGGVGVGLASDDGFAAIVGGGLTF